MTAAKPTQFYGRRKARPLRATRAQALDNLLPQLSLPSGGVLEPSSLFPHAQKYWLDIGFGNGELLAQWVQTMPDTGFIGVEPFINGVSAFLKQVAAFSALPNNIKIHMDIAEPVLARIKEQSLDVVSLLNPDPWPKARHAKRRFIRPENCASIARVLKPGGLFFTCTDSPMLAEHMALELTASKLFRFAAESKAGWETPPPFWAPTRYATKDMARSGRMYFLQFTRVA